MKTLVIDLATNSGFAVYDEAQGKVLLLDSVSFSGTHWGQRLCKCEDWFIKVVANCDIGRVYIEDVYIPKEKESKHTHTFKVLCMLRGIIEKICWERNIDFEAVEASAHHTRFLGIRSKYWKRNQIKAETIKRAKGLGYLVSNDNEADAVSILYYYCHRYQKPLLHPKNVKLQ